MVAGYYNGMSISLGECLTFDYVQSKGHERHAHGIRKARGKKSQTGIPHERLRIVRSLIGRVRHGSLPCILRNNVDASQFVHPGLSMDVLGSSWTVTLNTDQ